MLELYHFHLSVCSQKVRLCLAEKQLEWHGHHVDLMKFENTRVDYVAINPNGVVPTLVHDDRVVIESTVINEYLDDKFSECPLRPKDPWARAQMRTWIKLEDDTGLPNIGTLTLQRLIKPQLLRRSEQAMERMVAEHPDAERARAHQMLVEHDIPDDVLGAAESKLATVLDRMEAALTEGRWLAGADYSLADIAWLPFIDRMTLLGMASMISAEARPALADWYARCRERPAYRTAVVEFLSPPS